MPKDQIYAIRKIAAQKFPEIARPIEEAKEKAKETKEANLKQFSSRRDHVTPSGKSADLIGSLIGVSGSTVKRVDRLEREAPEELKRVTCGEKSVRA